MYDRAECSVRARLNQNCLWIHEDVNLRCQNDRKLTHPLYLLYHGVSGLGVFLCGRLWPLEDAEPLHSFVYTGIGQDQKWQS